MIYALDEIYEQNQAEMTVKSIGQRIRDVKNELNLRTEWRNVYDEAAAWFANEMHEYYPEDAWEPSQKAKADKDSGLSLIKDIMLAERLKISTRCQSFYRELDGYCKDKSGKIPKKNDHLIDDFRYFLDAEAYNLHNETEVIPEADENWRGARIEDDYPEMTSNAWPLD